jgi:hypothetical protein
MHRSSYGTVAVVLCMTPRPKRRLLESPCNETSDTPPGCMLVLYSVSEADIKTPYYQDAQPFCVVAICLADVMVPAACQSRSPDDTPHNRSEEFDQI